VPQALRIATYNVHDCVGRDRRYDPGRIGAVLRQLDADLVALQEVTVDASGALIEALGQDTGMQAVDGTLFARGAGRYGNLVLTRLPILDTHLHDLSVPGREPRGAIQLSVATDAGPLTICATHLGLRRAERGFQLAQLATLLNADGKPAVLLGDFNVWHYPRELAPIRSAGFAHQRVYSFPTWPYPMFALDRIFARAPLQIRACQRHDSRLARMASDHFPLLAELELVG
jgi:endonuclease/exonuclease/phosphatase family metal-dependent hydrolase